MSENLMPAKGPVGGTPRAGVRRALWRLAMIAAAAIVVVLGGGAWCVHRDLDLIQRERIRLQALGDSLRSEAPVERQWQAIEKRLGKVERSLSFASRAARVPEVIALRQWARRLDAQIQTNSERLAWIERRLDSLSVAPRLPDSLRTAWPGREAQKGASSERP